MSTLVRILVFAVTFIVTTSYGQDFQGIATYKTKRKVDVKLDSTQMASGQHQQIMEMLKKQFEKTYILTFDKQSSIYKEEESLSSPQPQGMQVMVVNTGAADILYKNTKENRFTNQNDIMGKQFLVQDTLVKHNWQLSSETKNIGDYTCYKATMTRQVEVRQGGISFNGDKDLDANENDEPTFRDQVTTAWYTTEIPVNNGPANYYGLPGLILEVNDGEETVICSKLVLNPKKQIEIKEPKKGKVVNQEEFDKIMEKKMKEMRERFKSRRGDGDGQEVEIRIGG